MGLREADTAVPALFTETGDPKDTPLSKNWTAPAGWLASAAVAVDDRVIDVPAEIGLATDGVGCVVEVMVAEGG